MTDIILKMLLFIGLGYLVGSIPTAVIVSKKFFGFDIRSKGSGNMGSTNAIRVLGTRWGAFVQICDIAKGTIPVLIFADWLGMDWGMCGDKSFLNLPVLEIIIGLSAVCGHIWSCFVGFKGGKGINTAAGMLIAIMPIELGIALGVFLIVLFLSGYVSLGSLIASLTIPITLFIRHNIFHVHINGYYTLIYFAIGLVVIIFYAHRSNIVRLFKGSENKFEKLHLIKCHCFSSK